MEMNPHKGHFHELSEHWGQTLPARNKSGFHATDQELNNITFTHSSIRNWEALGRRTHGLEERQSRVRSRTIMQASNSGLKSF